MRKGDIIHYGAEGMARPRIAVLISSDIILGRADISHVSGFVIREVEHPGLQHMDVSGFGFIDAATPERLYRGWIGEIVGNVGDAALETIAAHLRIAFDL
ncbi:hypothetical protein JMUB6875_06020 [Nocardia sp. JMUB6875]|uniref:hypothetical protein n=1 Tax=Nocardia sp. JMUB6875 TaxID=3158170 RepID=UPI0032E64908